MDKYAKLVDLLKKVAAPQLSVPILNAEVKEITGESCTVMIDELELTEVRLKATINGSENKIIVNPKVGSMVLIGSLTGDLKDLAVLRVDEIESIVYHQDGLKLQVDTTDKKISIENDEVNFLGLMSELVGVLKTLKVFTPSGVSGVPIPSTILKLNTFETNVKRLFK